MEPSEDIRQRTVRYVTDSGDTVSRVKSSEGDDYIEIILGASEPIILDDEGFLMRAYELGDALREASSCNCEIDRVERK